MGCRHSLVYSSIKVSILKRFNLPIMIAENGIAYRSDPRRHYGRRDNLLRSDFLRSHIAVVKELKSKGWPLHRLLLLVTHG